MYPKLHAGRYEFSNDYILYCTRSVKVTIRYILLLWSYYCVFMKSMGACTPFVGVHLFKSSEESCVCDCVHSNDRLHFLHDCIIT